jgi:autotransporter-associated beta strand protein
MKRLIVGLALITGLVYSAAAEGTSYNWRAVSGANWGDPTRWTPAGYPQAGDNANFTGTVAQTVNIATGNQTVSNVSVVGSAVWTWSSPGGGMLNLGGTFTYDGGATNSQFNAPIRGNGALVVNSGRLMLSAGALLSNEISAVTVNGGVLTAGRAAVGANTNVFGAASTVLQVGALAGTNDATIEFGNAYGTAAFTYWQPIVIRAGSSGRASLRNFNASGTGYGSRLGGGITLNKDLHLASDFLDGASWWSIAAGVLDVTGPITGTGNVYLDDVSDLVLSGTNSFMGDLIVNANNVWVKSPDNNFTGAVRITRGALYANKNGALGAAANQVILGGAGTLGALAMNSNDTSGAISACFHPMTLAGNGGILTGTYGVRPFLYGPIGGSGRLIVSHSMTPNFSGVLYGANTYSGGTLVVDGGILGGTNTAFGTGDIEISVNGYVGLYHASNVGAGAKILVKRNPLMDTCGRSGGELGLAADVVPTIDPASNGKLAINTRTAATPLINAWLGNGAQPIGDGTMFLGSWDGSTLGATGLTALVANDPTHTYKLGTSWADLVLRSTNTYVGALVDVGGQAYNVQIGRPNAGGNNNNIVTTYDDQKFSGTLTVWPSGYAYFRMYSGASANCVGATNGNIVLNGHRDDNTFWRSLFIENTANVGRTVRKNDLQFNGSAFLLVDAFSGAPTWTTTVQVATLTRGGRSTLAIQGYRGFLGNRERLMVTNGVPSNNGMVAPWLWNDAPGAFLDYGATGFITNQWDGTTLAGASATSKISLGATEQIPAEGATVYALRVTNIVAAVTNNISILANGTASLTNSSGGVLLIGIRTTIEAPLEFGASEALVITRDNGSEHRFSGQVRGTGGLTKTGKGRLWLSGDNRTLSGGITVNQGELTYTNWSNLGYNDITLNGGALWNTGVWTAANSPSITNNIVLGPCGGTLGSVDNAGHSRFYGSISGAGWVSFKIGWYCYVHGVSTYSGGTFIEGMTGLNLYTNDALGTGPLFMGYGQNSSSHMNNFNAVAVWHERALNTNTFVEMKSHPSQLFLRPTSVKMGSVSGNGCIFLGGAYGANRTEATFGLDNRDASYFGQINQVTLAQPGTLVKAGSGTWTLWGLVTLNGGVTVTNGTLCVNNWVNTESLVRVYPGATLDGIGTVGVVSNLGGTVKGNLIMQQLSLGPNSVLQVALNGPGAGQYDVATVNGPLNLTGGALALTLGFKPTPGQTFTILNNAGGSISGQFALGQTVSGTYNGQAYGFKVTYNSGTSIVLTALSRGTVIGVY